MKSLYNFLLGKGQIGALFLAIICIVIVMGSIFSGLGGAGYDAGTDLVAILKDKDSTQTFDFFNASILIPTILIVIAVIALVVFGVMGVVTHPKASMKAVISAGIVLLLFFLFYSISDSETTGKVFSLLQKNDIGEGTSKFISGGIKTSVTLIIVSFLTAAGGEIYNFFK
jgi:hypothetical protein